MSTRKINRRQFISSVALTAAGAALAACAPASTPISEAGGQQQAPQAATTVPTEAEAAAELAPVTLSFIYPHFGNVPDLQLVEDAVNQITEKKINAKIKLMCLDYAKFEERIRLMNSAGEAYDIAYTCSWTNDYYINVSQGNLIPLDDLLQKYSPERYEYIDKLWKGVKVNGKTYAVIGNKQPPAAWGPVVRKDLADKYGLDISTVKTYADLEPFLQQIKENEPDITSIYSDDSLNGGIRIFGYDFISFTGGVAVRFDDPALKIVNLYETKEFDEVVALARKYYDAGYFTTEPKPAADAQAAMKAGQYAVILDQWYPGSESGYKSKFGYDFVGKAIEPVRNLQTNNVTAIMYGISRTSKNPERSLMFLELLYTDPMLHHILARGVEGKHWVWEEEGKTFKLPEGVTQQNNGYASGVEWLFGDCVEQYFFAEPGKSYEDMLAVAKFGRKETDEAVPSVALGFALNADNVKNELAQVSAVVKEYSTLTWGLVDPATALPEFREKLKAAGIDTVVSETQSQIDAWKKANG